MKKRIDVLLTEKGFFTSRSKAVMAIKNGSIKVNGAIVLKAGEMFDELSDIKVVGETLQYVSRGGLKLEKAIEVFNIDFKDKVVLDLGASTGGFTDCALQNGARQVYAVDVGSNQLVESLRNDKRVVNLEQTDAKTLKLDIFNKCEYIVADISFVSIVKIVESIFDKITTQKLMLLVKPQFECGIEIAKKYKGVIRDEKLSREIADKTIKGLEKLGLKLIGVAPSPIRGGDGNAEYISYWSKQ
jgi:23S rRNA (cytidine1920-2'-O)/16S rRNA (cytidine1409-2'-O)-methyltransferase